MIAIDELKKMIRRNQCLGMWAAEKLGLVGSEAEAYAKALAVGALEPDDRDVFSKIRKDFDVAGVAQSDDQILQVIYEFTLQVAGPDQSTGASGGAAAVMLARKISGKN